MRAVEQYHHAQTVEEAVRLLQQHQEAALIAGGTWMVPRGEARVLVDIARVPLGQLAEQDGQLTIGALVTLQQLVEGPHSFLAAAARESAGHLVRNAATVGGVIISALAGHELLTALLALDARLTLVGQSARQVTLEEQLRTGVRRRDQVLTEITVPGKVPAARHRVSRGHPDRSIVSVAVCRHADGFHVALGGMEAAPYRLPQAEQAANAGQAVDAVVREHARADSDFLASAEYRREVAGVLARRAMEEIAK
ncbi:MAG: FAD binding domain-containing protein [Candidatus Xenobia bacterium]